MQKELSDEEAQLVTIALHHYHAYLVATQREDRRYQALAERLQRKAPGKEPRSEEPVKRKRG